MSDNEFASVGETIKALRTQANLSQATLARRSGFNHSYISRLESGARPITRAGLERISTALGLTDAEDRVLLNAGGFLARSMNGEDRDFVRLRNLLDNPLIRLDLRDAVRMVLAGVCETLQLERDFALRHPGKVQESPTTVTTVRGNGAATVKLEQRL
jgi:transcriptional regulator with XRE-family HTH domain